MVERSGGPGLAALGESEIAAVERILRSGRLTRYSNDEDEPSATYTFEREAAGMLQVGYCLAFSSGSAAMLAGLWALDLEPGAEVLVPGFAFSSCYSAIALSGAVPVLVEIDDDLGMDPDDMVCKITDRTRAAMVVHMLGRPAKLDRLGQLAVQHGLHLIEDAAQAFGATLGDRAIGSLGRFGTFSFNPFKVITAGDGGLFTTSDESLYERAFSLHDHGARPLRTGLAGAGPFMGINLRMNEVAAAIALQQLRRLPGLLDGPRMASADLMAALELPLNVSASVVPGDCGSVVILSFQYDEQARRFAELVGTHALSQSGKHNYAELKQLQTWAFPRAVPRPGAAQLAAYAPGALPRTDQILARTVALGVGVHDDYLGTAVGVDPADGHRERRQAAAEISIALRRAVQGV